MRRVLVRGPVSFVSRKRSSSYHYYFNGNDHFTNGFTQRTISSTNYDSIINTAGSMATFRRFYSGAQAKENKIEQTPKPAQDIPGPTPDKSNGLLTNLPQINAAGGFVPFLKDVHSKYGPITKFHLTDPKSTYSTLCVSLSSPELVKQTSKIGDRPKHLFDFLIPLIGPDNFQIMPADPAKHFRRHVGLPSLSPKYIKNNFDFLKSQVDNSVKFIREKNSSSSTTDPAKIYMQKDFLTFGLYIVAGILAKDTVNQIDLTRFKAHYDALLNQTFDEQFGISDPDPASLQKSSEAVHQYFLNILATRREQRKSKQQQQQQQQQQDALPDFLDLLLDTKDVRTGELYTDEMIASHLSVYITAGYHTTIVALSWCTFLLCSHVDVQRKLQAEIDQYFEKQESITFEALQQQMPHLDDVVREALRVKGPATFAAREVNGSGVTIGGYEIEDKTCLLYALHSINTNKENFEQPENFMPERWEKLKEKKNDALPFGTGARYCPGDKLAWIEMKLFLVELLKRFDMELACKPQEVISTERFVVWAEKDVPVFFRERRR